MKQSNPYQTILYINTKNNVKIDLTNIHTYHPPLNHHLHHHPRLLNPIKVYDRLLQQPRTNAQSRSQI